MNLEPFSKNKSLIGVISIIAAGLAYTIYELVSGGKLLTQLNSDKSFILLIICISGLFLIFFLAFITFIVKGDNPAGKPKSTLKRKKKKSNKSFKIIVGAFLAILGVLIFLESNTGSNIYQEDFASNEFPSDWIEGEQSRSLSFLANGFYTLISKSHPISRRINVLEQFQFSLPDERAFRISMKIKDLNKTTKGTSFGGLEWNSNSRESVKYGFYINTQGQYSLKLYKHSNEIADYVNWVNSSAINLHGSNSLEVIKDPSKLSFLINDVELFAIDELPFIGYEIGFGVGPNTRMVVDNLYLKK